MRKVGATIAIAVLPVTWTMAQESSRPAATANERVTVAGCLAQAGSRFLLNGAITSTDRHRSAGSNSAKASTPVRYVESPTSDRSGKAGSNSPKGSTPLPTGTSAATERKTGGAVSAKGSVPVARPALQLYEVIGVADQLSTNVGHTVEIDGAISADSAKPDVPRLSVQQLKVLSSSCPQ
jgi:hypothetical protein